MDTVIAYLLALSLPLWLVVEELLHWRETDMAADAQGVECRHGRRLTTRFVLSRRLH